MYPYAAGQAITPLAVSSEVRRLDHDYHFRGILRSFALLRALKGLFEKSPLRELEIGDLNVFSETGSAGTKLSRLR
jgi:hypothetical protein